MEEKVKELAKKIINKIVETDEKGKYISFDTLAKTKLEKIKYILISNGLEYLRRDINEITSDDTCELWIEQFCKNKIIDILLSCESLNDSQKDIIIKRFGLLGERCHSLEEVAKMHGVTRERIRQKEAKVLRILRNPKYAKQFKDLM